MKTLKFKPVLNKKNKQVNFSFKKSDMPKDLREAFRKNEVNVLKLKFEGFE